MSARPQVTITLGRSGQVVKRAASDIGQSESLPLSGCKRSIRERLGSSMDSTYLNGSQSRSKRQRRANHDWSDDDLKDDKRYMFDRLVSQDDLRYKLLHKSLSGQSKFVDEERNRADLREKLSRNRKISSRFDGRDGMPVPRAAGHMRRIAPTRSADDLLQMDSLRKSYSSWTLDTPRHRSPDRLVGSSSGISSPRSFNEMRHASSVRSFDPPRPSTFTTKVVDSSRHAPFMSKPAVPIEAAKPIARVPPTSEAVHKSSYKSEQGLTVASLLHSLGLEKYAIHFQAEEVDMTVLKQMGDNDLKELGIPMGPRKKILLAVQPRSRRHF